MAATIRRVAGCELGTWQQIISIDPGQPPEGPEVDRADHQRAIHAAFFGSIRTKWVLRNPVTGNGQTIWLTAPAHGVYVGWVLIYLTFRRSPFIFHNFY
jgi:hypothetical protein